MRKQSFVVGMDDHDDGLFHRPCRKDVKRMGDNRPSADGAILLGAIL